MLKKTLLLVTLFSLIAFAGWQERSSFYLHPINGWTSQTGLATARGRFWVHHAPVGGECNKQTWVIPFTDSVSVAQWIRWSIEGQKTLWRIRKIGTFAGYGPKLCIKSNEQVAVTFSGFENPKGPSGNEIAKWYYFADSTAVAPGVDWTWISAADLNGLTLTIGPCMEFGRRIWERIEVEQCDRACEYVDPAGATITLTLQVMKDYIDPLTGHFRF